MLRAFPVFASRDGDGVQGVWLSRDGKALVARPQRELLTETTPATASIDPHKPLPVGNVIDGSATLALITSAVPPLLPLKGDAREAAVLALGLSASDRAVVRATLALASSKRGGSSRAGLPIQGPELIRILPLGRGFLVELVTAAPYSSCTGGNSSGWAEVIVIGAQVYVTVHVEGRPGHCRGRRPPGYRDDSSEHPSAEARFFDDAARLELASVAAFELLAHELDVFGAPRALIERAHAARADEVRHAAQMTARATRHGVDLRPCGAPTFAPRALFEVALDNAVEGCVHEAFAATIAHFQAVTVCDSDLACELAAIAADEAEHGQLAWDLATWLEPQLASDERALVTRARALALEALVAGADAAATGSVRHDHAARRTLGLPSPDQATALARGFAAACRASA